MTFHTVPLGSNLVDDRPLRAALGRFATGVAVVTTRGPDGKLEGVTANSFSAVSLDPPIVLWSLKRNAPSLPRFVEAGAFAVNVLSASQRDLSRHFATPNHDKFATVRHLEGRAGCPLLEETLASFECSAESLVEGGDHVIFLGRVQRARYRDGEPLIFSAGRYCTPALMADTA